MSTKKKKTKVRKKTSKKVKRKTKVRKKTSKKVKRKTKVRKKTSKKVNRKTKVKKKIKIVNYFIYSIMKDYLLKLAEKIYIIQNIYYKNNFLIKKKSYSMHGEDLIVENYLKEITNGFFVDIGCYHPIQHNNCLLYTSPSPRD